VSNRFFITLPHAVASGLSDGATWLQPLSVLPPQIIEILMKFPKYADFMLFKLYLSSLTVAHQHYLRSSVAHETCASAMEAMNLEDL
jgi:hypothetical protein